MTRARHLLVGQARVACGQRGVTRWSSDPAEVTCALCKRTLAMADAEIQARLNKGATTK